MTIEPVFAWARSIWRGRAWRSGPGLQYFSGKPWAATTQVALPQGDQRILLDLRVSKPISFGRMGHIEVILDVLNVLNDTDALSDRRSV